METPGTLLITGGTGTIGTALVPRLLDKGYRVRLFALPGDKGAALLAGEGVELVFGDIADPEAVSGLCDGVSTVLHLAAVILSDDEQVFDRVNVTGTRYLLADAKNYGVRHFIHVSSASVVYRKMTPYSRSKRIAERYVLEAGVPWTIVRPTLVYGPTGGMEFDLFLDYLVSWPLLPFIGNGRALKRPVHVDDMVDGLEKITLCPAGTSTIYNLSGASAISMMEFARLCLVLLGREDKMIVPLPVVVCRVLAAIMKRTMRRPPLTWNMIAGVTQSADLDPAQAIAEVGYSPQPVETRLAGCFPRKR